jgi:hypothetical protein
MARTPRPSDSEYPLSEAERIKLARRWQSVAEDETSGSRPSTLLPSKSDTAVSLPKPPGAAGSSILRTTPTKLPAPMPAPAPPSPLPAPLVRNTTGDSPNVPSLATLLESVSRARTVTPRPMRKKSFGWRRAARLISVLLLGVTIAIWVLMVFGQNEPPPETVLADKPKPVLSAREAFDRIGEDVRVQFTVRDYTFTPGPRQSLYLYAVDKDPEGGQFRLIVTPDVVSELASNGRIQANSLEGSVARAHGVVTRDKRLTEICISRADQLEKLPGEP